jgi:hypothetical protein
MAQTILTVVAEVQPASADLLRCRIKSLTASEEETRIKSLTASEEETRIESLRASEEEKGNDQKYDHIRSAVPTLHFMSITVADDDQYDPIFVLEANFDGEPGPFWAQLEEVIGPDLRDMLRMCKRPRGQRGVLFDTVTRPNSGSPLAPLLEALSVFPSARHQGNRGLNRDRIIDEGKLFAAIQDELDATPSLALATAVEIHERLRAALLPRFAWLKTPAKARISLRECLADKLRVLVFVVRLMVVSAIVGWLLVLVAGQVWPAPATPWGWLDGWLTDDSFCNVVVKVLLLILLGAVIIVLPAAARLRWLENRDTSCDAPKLDAKTQRAIASREDFIAQNHMISIVHLKPGVLRMILAREAHRVLGLYVRNCCRDGYLGSMRTIHFAHWAFLDNGARLMFHSNYDGSWEGYLDDFIERAHAGLTLAWTHGVGFPRTRWLYQGGATEGRKFKDWARHSMSESQFWFSAYKRYSVNDIERHARLANGLRQQMLNGKEARAWAIDL